MNSRDFKIFSSHLPFWLFVSFAIGITLGFFCSVFWVFAVVVVLAVFSALFFYKKQNFFLSDLCIIILFISLGATWAIPSIQRGRSIDNIVGARSPRQLTIKITTIPQQKSTRNTCHGIVEALCDEETRCIASLRKRIKVFDYTRQLQYLRSYNVVGKISRRNYQGRNFYTLWIKKDAEVKHLPLPFWDRYAIKTTDYLLSVFKNNLSEQGYRFMSSVFLGRRELLGEEKQILTNAGAAHLLAISGLHFSLTAFILFFILKIFNIKFRARLIISLFFLGFYAFLTGAGPSTLRAVIMYAVFVFSFFAKRKANAFNSLALAGLAALLMNSSMLFEIGFQLSFAAVFAIILGMKVFKIKPVDNLILSYLQYIILCSFFVVVFLTPLVSYYFGKVYILSILYNAVFIPFFTFILMVNFLLVIFSPFMFVAESLGAILSLLIFFFIEVVRVLGSIRFSFIYCVFSVSAIFVYYFFLAGILSFFVLKKGKSVS